MWPRIRVLRHIYDGVPNWDGVYVGMGEISGTKLLNVKAHILFEANAWY